VSLAPPLDALTEPPTVLALTLRIDGPVPLRLEPRAAA
jgi:hypothetical protein